MLATHFQQIHFSVIFSMYGNLFVPVSHLGVVFTALLVKMQDVNKSKDTDIDSLRKWVLNKKVFLIINILI